MAAPGQQVAVYRTRTYVWPCSGNWRCLGSTELSGSVQKMTLAVCPSELDITIVERGGRGRPVCLLFPSPGPRRVWRLSSQLGGHRCGGVARGPGGPCGER